MYHNKSVQETLKELKVNQSTGLSTGGVEKSRQCFGRNQITPKKEKSVFSRIISALLEPMMIILLIAFVITLGVNLGKFFRRGDGEFIECIGIFIAIAISVCLNVVMEGRSQKAFLALGKIGGKTGVKVLRGGETTVVDSTDVVVGDIIYLSAGDKVVADARLISINGLKTDESMLTGESAQVTKNAGAVLKEKTPLAERVNSVYSGTFITAGDGVAVVTAVGDSAEMGRLAQDLAPKAKLSAPLEEKLSKLGTVISIFGGISALFVFVLSFVRLAVLNQVNFMAVEDIFIESIILLVACVPEGLPSTVAISLTLNVLKLAKSNALIKKLIATETIGSVSIICSDKTGTLTENQMTVERIEALGKSYSSNSLTDKYLLMNFSINSTADIINGEVKGSQTEGALLKTVERSGENYKKLRKSAKILAQVPFSSQIKYMETEIESDGERLTLIKGAPEKIMAMVTVGKHKLQREKEKIAEYQSRALRVIAFAHKIQGTTFFDGFAVLEDNIRSDVLESINACHKAGIKVKMLTGDNIITAKSVADKLGIGDGYGVAVSGEELETWSDEKLASKIGEISVVARSTPKLKMRIVKALQKIGEVVAVTGDGVNDAPAIRHADIGIAMGDGSEVTKEASDVVLLDNRFSTIITAISFGRNIYRNFQRFITFQLTVNISSMCIIIAFLIMGMESPFTSTGILWLNIIMDGPLAISLALEKPDRRNLEYKPIKRSENIISTKIAIRIAVSSLAIATLVVLQQMFNYLGATVVQLHTVIFATFVMLQIFNAINCREIRLKSALSGLFGNKLLIFVGVITFLLQIIITQFVPSVFQTVPLEFSLWCKITLLASSIVWVWELVKLILRTCKGKYKEKYKMKKENLC